MFALIRHKTKTFRGFVATVGILVAFVLAAGAAAFSVCEGDPAPGDWLVNPYTNTLNVIMAHDSGDWISRCIINYGGTPTETHDANGGEIDICQHVTQYPYR